MTHLEWVRTLPGEDMAKLMLCPNERLRRNDPIISCDRCIAKFLQTEVPEEA